jgi:DNA-binding response OmpR family regulator/class 3 adenylate cyclase/tetratricopeptide (TPR) repeat protein
MKSSILVVARDADRRAMLARRLMGAGYAVELSEDPRRARELAQAGGVRLAVLAQGDFGAAGADLARQLRDSLGEVILVDGRDEGSLDILERVRSALQPQAEPRAQEPEVLRFDGWHLDVSARSLRRDNGSEISLTRSEFELLLTFLRHAGRVLSRDQLRSAVAGRNVEAYERSVDMLVGRLRRKLETDAKQPRLIITVAGVGYRFAVKPQALTETATALGTRPEAAKRAEAGGRASPEQSRSPERRQVTVISCEFVVSGPQSARLDPEDLQAAIAACSRCCGDVVGRFGGVVVHHLGHKLIASFGYPATHEDSAERAVQAALALAAALPELAIGAGLLAQVCIGVATGVVIVGSAEGGVPGQPVNLLGDTPRIAEALQGTARPGQVIIAASTRRLVRGLFRYVDLAPLVLKFFDQPLEAAQVLGTGATESRFEAWQEGRSAPLVGREEECELLRRRWRQAAGGDGRLVLLTGEPGIGKSRLVATLTEEIKGGPHALIRFLCSPRRSHSTLFPVIVQLERALAFAPGETPTEKLAKLESFLRKTGFADAEVVALIGHLLALPIADRYPVPELSPQKRKEKTFAVLLDWLARMAEREPLLVVFEDVHWIDPTSLEILSLVAARVARLPILLLVTARPEFTPPWASDAHVTSLALTRLGQSDVTALMAQISGEKILPPDVRDQIVARADGVPLFVEELTKSVLESGVPDRGAVPSSLQDSLMARLDRLGEPRTVAQIGAALGREFSHELIVAVTSLPRPQLETALDALVAAGVIFRRGVPPDAEYIFKHALLQDVAHGSLTRRSRQELHARIASVFEQAFPGLAAGQPERLAHHHAEAGAPEKAAAYSLKAGMRALAQSAMTEAAAQLRNGLELLSSSPASDERERLELDLQLALARAMMATQGYAALAVGETYARARELCLRLDQPPQLVTVLYGQFLHNFMRAELQKAWGLAQEMLRLGEAQNKPPLTLMGRRLLGVTALAFGDFAAAAAHLERCLKDFDPADRPFYASLAIDDLRINMMGYLATALLSLGRLDEAHARIAATLDEARRLSHGYTLVHALMTACWYDWCGAEWTSLLRHTEEMLELSNRHGFGLFRALAEVIQGCALAALGRAEEGLPILHRGLAVTRAIGQGLHLPQTLTMLAYAYGKADQPEEGLRRLAEAAEIAETTQDRWSEAELCRVRGDLLLATGRTLEAENSFRQALSVARRQNGRLWELRVAVSLARLWHSQGRDEEARTLLQPIYAWFKTAVRTPDLENAQELLGRLQLAPHR